MLLTGLLVSTFRQAPSPRNELFGPVNTNRSPATYTSPTGQSQYLNNPQQVQLDAQWMQTKVLLSGYPHSVDSHPKMVLLKNLDAARAALNHAETLYTRTGDLKHLTGGLNLFNAVLPYRASLMTDPQKLAAHDAQIAAFVNHPQVRFRFVDSKDHAWELDQSTQYLLVAHLMELIHNRWDLMEKEIIGKRPPLNILVYQDLNKHTIWADKEKYGYISLRNSDVHISQSDLWSSFFGLETTALGTHEFTHVLEMTYSQRLKLLSADGFLPGLNKQDKATFRQEYDRLRTTFKKSGNSNGLGSYAFSDIPFIPFIWEFTSETVALFQADPQTLKKASPKIYDIYSRYFQFDSLTLRDSKKD